MNRHPLAHIRLGVRALPPILSCMLLAAPAAHGEWTTAAPGFFYDSGTLVPGAEGCLLFNSISFGNYQLSDPGGFGAGDRIFVVGDLKACYSPCFPSGCITVDTIRPWSGTDLLVAAPKGVSVAAGTLLSAPVGVVGTGLIWVEADLSNLPTPNSASFAWIPPGVIGPSERGRGTFSWTPSPEQVRAEPYTVTFQATGLGRTGTATTAVRVDAAATIVLVPRLLNRASQGRFVTAFIQLQPGFAPESIDLPSLRLDETIPPSSKSGVVGNFDGDRVPALMVKFDRSRIVDLGPGVHTLRLTGSLTSGVHFAGVAEVSVTQPTEPAGAGLAARVASRPGSLPVVVTLPERRPEPLAIRVFDVRGRLVKAWTERSDRGPTIVWDGKGNDGSAARSGVYLFEMSAAGRRGVVKAILVR